MNKHSDIHKRFNLLLKKTITEKDLVLIHNSLIDILKTIFNIDNVKIEKGITRYQLLKIVYYDKVSNQYFIYNLKYHVLNHSNSKNYLKIQIEEDERKELDFKTILVETGINIEIVNLIIDQKLLEII